MNLIPIWLRLGSIAELKPIPKKERRRLFNEAWAGVNKPYRFWTTAVLVSAFFLVNKLGGHLGKAAGGAGIFAFWPGLVKTLVIELVLFAAAFWIAGIVIGTLLQKRLSQRLRDILSNESNTATTTTSS